jgi:hypothetical protein
MNFKILEELIDAPWQEMTAAIIDQKIIKRSYPDM